MKFSAIPTAEENMTCSDMRLLDMVEERKDSDSAAEASEICSGISSKTFSVVEEDAVELNKGMIFNII